MSVTAEALRSRRLGYEPAAGARAVPAGGLTSLPDLLALAFKYRLRFLLALFGPPVVAAMLIYALPAVYRAQTSLVVGSGPEYLAPDDGGSVMTAPMTTKQEFVNTEIELLSNPAVVENTITRVGLANLYPELLSAQLGPQLARDTAVRSFEAALRVEPVKLSNVIRVTFDHANGQMAARTLDQFVLSYQELHAKVFAGRRAAGYEERIARDMKELEALERTRAETKAAFGVYDLGQQRTALIQQRVEAERQLRQTVDRADALSTRLAYLAQTRPNIVSEMLSSQTETNPAATHAAELLVDLRQKEAALVSVYDAQNPMVRRLRQQIDAAQKQLAEMHATTTRISLTPSPITTAIDQDLVTSQAELAPLKAQQTLGTVLIAVIGQKMRRLERAEMELRALDARIADQNEALRGVLLLYNKASEADETDQTKLTSVVQPTNATISNRPVAINEVALMVGGGLSGLISAGGVLAFAVGARRRSVGESGLLLALPVQEPVPMRVSDVHWLE